MYCGYTRGMLGLLCIFCLDVLGFLRRGVSRRAYEVLEFGVCGDWNGFCGYG